MEFIKGMDLSSYQEMKDKKKVYFDETGKEVDAMKLARMSGANYIRLRIWNHPKSVPESGGYCDLEETIKAAKRIKQENMKFLLDFHYSDWWADPGNQTKPKAWENLSVAGLKEAVYAYTKEVLVALRDEGVYPDMVQIGNEIRTGMLFPEGAIPNWENLAKFVNAGIRAVRDISDVPKIKIMIHLDQGGKYGYFKEWFDEIMRCGVTDFDIIGLSYYPFWHGTFEDLKYTLEHLVERYDKELILAEVAYPYRKSKGVFFKEAQERAGGFLATEENQKKVMDILFCTTANVSKNKGIGIFYWEPFTYGTEDENGWGNYMGFAKDDGTLSNGLSSFSQNPYEISTKEIAKIYLPTIFENQTAKEIKQRMATVLYMDGISKKESIEVLRENEDDTLTLSVLDWVFTATKEKLPSGENRVINPDSFFNPDSWCIKTQHEVHLTEKENGLYFQGKTNFSLYIEQTIHVLKPGVYQAYLLYEGENTTGVDIRLFVKGADGERECVVFPDTGREAYFKTEPLLFNESKEITIGVRIDAPPVWGEIKEIFLVKESDFFA